MTNSRNTLFIQIPIKSKIIEDISNNIPQTKMIYEPNFN